MKEAMKLALEYLKLQKKYGPAMAYGNTTIDEAIDAIKKVLVADFVSDFVEQPAPVQQEWATVPVEPTVAMIDATGAVEADMREMVVANWQEMLAAAPQPAQQEPVAKYIGECSEGSLVQLYDDVKKGTNFYTSQQPAPVNQKPYGYCPICGAEGVMRERRPNGYDKCANGHTYPSSKANHGIKENT